MLYQQIRPPEYLKNYVRYFWVSENESAGIVPYSFTTIPDGGPGLVFQNPDKGRYWENGQLMPTLFLYGLSTKHATYEFTGVFDTIGVHFYPHALKSVFGMDANELTDIFIDMEMMANGHGFFLAGPLSQSIPVKDKIELLSQYLFCLIRKNSSGDHYGMQYALQKIISLKGNIAVKNLQDHLYLSERSIERKFQQYVGMSPRLFTRICRFQASLSQLRMNGYVKLSDIAYENEYSDQSHLIRSFKEFSGISPSQYQQQTDGVITKSGIISDDDPLVGDIQFYRLK